MADETRVKWIYPPNFEGTYDDFNASRVGHRRHVVHCTNISDGSGEDIAIKLKRDDLRTAHGNTPAKLIIDKIEWEVAGMTVKIHYNNMNDEEVAVLYSGQGVKNYTAVGGYVPEKDNLEDEHDYAGDICISTDNETIGDSYDIMLHVRTHE